MQSKISPYPLVRVVLTSLKSIICVWTCIQLILPGCLCQLLGPLGFALPHHHGEQIITQVEQRETWQALPVPDSNPAPACHCHESPDHTTDDVLIQVTEDAFDGVLGFTHALVDETALRLFTTFCATHGSRAPPELGSAQALRIARCVHLL